jgi:hypothetical protein
MEKTKDIIWTVILRTAMFPFFLGIACIGASVLLIQWIVNYIRFGGETIAYTDKTRRKTILDVFNKLCELEESDDKK